MGDQVLVETHLRWCQTCAARLEDTQTIGASLRLTARAHAHHESHDETVAEDLGRALACHAVRGAGAVGHRVRAVVRRTGAGALLGHALWWPAMGATVAVALSVGVASNIWKATSVQQPASLAAVIESLADQPQRLDAAMYLPRLADGGDGFDPGDAGAARRREPPGRTDGGGAHPHA
jgi:hypothetical protein